MQTTQSTTSRPRGGETSLFGSLWDGITSIFGGQTDADTTRTRTQTQTRTRTRTRTETATERQVYSPGTLLATEELSSNIPFSLPLRRRKDRLSFLTDLRKGDILLSTPMQYSVTAVVGQIIGHAAIMATKDWVIEMPGEVPGSGSSASYSFNSSSSGSQLLRASNEKGNNRRISKGAWYDVHRSDNILVYRCSKHHVAEMAADWAYTHYYNSSGGEEKNIHVQYSVASPVFRVRDPSYCSKLVLQSYYYGTGDTSVLWPTVEVPVTVAILPTTIPTFFKPAYSLSVVGLY